MTATLFIGFSCVLILCYLIYQRHKRICKAFPPGPTSLPVIGSIPFIGMKRGIVAALIDRCLYKYDPNLCTLWIGNKSIIVIQNFELAKDLFSRDEFSGRTTHYHAKYVRGINGESLGLIATTGSFWQDQRRFTIRNLKNLGFGRQKLDTLIQDEVQYLIDGLLTRCKHGDILIDGLFNFPIINILWQIVASKKFDQDLPECKSMMSKVNVAFQQGPSLFQFIIQSPFLRSLLPRFKQEIAELDLKKLFRQQIVDHEQELNLGETHESMDFIDIYLRKIQQNDDYMNDYSGAGKYSNFNTEQLVVICLDLFQAGSETSSTTLSWAVMFLALYKDVQEKCRNEIDLILGSK